MGKIKHQVVKVGFTNCYLLECKDGYLQIDTGYPKDYSKYKQRLKKKYNIEVNEIKHLILTHHHDDHAGFAAKLLEESKASLIVHENALERLKSGTSEIKSRSLNRRVKFVFGFFNKFHEFQYPPVIPYDNVKLLKGSQDNHEVLRDIGLEGVIIHTPGHTEDGISIILDDGSVFPGDNAMNAWFFNILGIQKRPLFTQDLNLIFKSWKQYINLKGKRIYPAHGKDFSIELLSKKLSKFKPNSILYS
jgi:glyoxylase-like metal-dependent hydrolase (beta-lactamase superfamily II)